jgi:hypothetical protein
MQRAGCGSLLVLLFGISLVLMLIESTAFWISLGVIILGGFVAFDFWKKKRASKNVAQMYALRPQLLRFTKGFEPLEDLYLSLQKDEKAFYEREGVSLYEYKSSGSTMSGGFLGGSLGVTDNIAITAGGFEGQTTQNPEEVTVIDVGKVIFTNQRVLFIGPNHTREFVFSNLLDLNVSENGFTVRVSVSGRQKASALAADAAGGLTPGFAFAMAVEMFQHGEQKAMELASQILGDIESQYRKQIAGS